MVAGRVHVRQCQQRRQQGGVLADGQLDQGALGLGDSDGFALAGRIAREHSPQVGVLALYWHFVDAVWVVVFTVVYVIGR